MKLKGSVGISGRGRLKKIPAIFDGIEVSGDFYCSSNQLTSLEGAPKTVGGDFFCSCNKLKSLDGAPKTVGGNFYCHSNAVKFTEAQVRAVCKVRGSIYI